MSTNSRASSRSDRDKSALDGLESSSILALFLPFFLGAFSTPNLVPTGNSISIQEIRFFNASWTDARHLLTASLTSRGSSDAAGFCDGNKLEIIQSEVPLIAL